MQYYNNYPQQIYPNAYQAVAPVQSQPQAQPQIQNGGFVSVRNETEARNYPVALGNSVTFKDETAPYIYTKTMGFSQLDIPKFDKYKLVKETPEEVPETPKNEIFDPKPINDSIDALKAEIGRIWSEIEGLKNVPAKKTNNAKRDKDGDD